MKAQAARLPRKDSKNSILVMAIPIETPIIPRITELPTCPSPHKKVISIVLGVDQFLALDIMMNGR